MKYPFWVTGFSAVSVSGTPTNAQLDLMLSDSAPNSTIGVEVLSASAPDVVVYPDLIRARWAKLDGSGNKTGDFYYHDGTSWQQEEARVVDGESLIDASVPITKLSAAGGDPLDFIQVNALRTGFQFVSTIALTKLQASIDGNVIYNNSGTWTASNLNALVESFIFNFPFDVSQIGDRDTAGLANQVPYLIAPSSGCGWKFADEVLRDGQVDPKKLTFPSTSAGSHIKVNATYNGFDYDTPGAGEAVVVSDTGVSGYVAQAISGTTVTVARFTSVDVATWCTLASNKITLTAGSYLFDIVVPIYESTSGYDGYVALYNATSNTLLRAVRWDMGGDMDSRQMTLKHAITLTASTDFEVRVYGTGPFSLGQAGSFASITECYQQVAIHKLA